jgi:type II secretory pathway component PulC
LINYRLKLVYEAGLITIAATILFGSLAVYRLLQSGKPDISGLKILPLAWLKIDANAFCFDASAFKKIDVAQENVLPGEAARKFRLAGTFFAVGVNQQSRKAILDDLLKKTQLLVNEGDLLDGDFQVVSILSDKIILRKGGMEEQILLCFAGKGGAKPADAGARGNIVIETQNRFGKRVGDKRWVLKRAELMSYYSELLNNTDRLAKIYESLKPVYEGQNIAGYNLDIEGEAEIFGAIGLKQGDIIRQVNSLPMTSQLRAEYFLNEFVKNRVNGFVIDIEREGKKDRLIYMVR